MLDPEVLAFALVAIFVAGVVQAVTGFGFGIVAIPLLALFISPKLAAPIIALTSIVLNIVILQRSHADVDYDRVWVRVLAAIAGLPIGTWMLVHWDVDVLRVYIGATTVIVTLIFLRGFQRQVGHEKLASVPIGFLSGVMNGSIQMAGPPVILFLNNQRLPRAVFRASIVAYFFILSIATLPFLASGGLLTRRVFLYALAVSPALVLGGIVGSRLVHRVDEAAVRRLTLCIVLGAGVTSVLSGTHVI